MESEQTGFKLEGGPKAGRVSLGGGEAVKAGPEASHDEAFAGDGAVGVVKAELDESAVACCVMKRVLESGMRTISWVCLALHTPSPPSALPPPSYYYYYYY